MYEWPEAFDLAVFMVLDRHHCLVSACCGPIGPEEWQEIEELAMDLISQEESNGR